MPNPALAYSMMTESILCACLVAILWRRGLFGEFRLVSILVIVWLAESFIATGTLYFRKRLGLSLPVAFHTYVYSFWIYNVISHIITLCILYQVFRRAMVPFSGLRRLGTLVFRWIFCFAFIVAFAMVVAPHGDEGRYATLTTQFQQGTSILTICVMLFVCFAGRQLGVTLRSRLFGVSLGLGIQGVTGLILMAWSATNGPQSLYSSMYLIPAFGGIATLAVWSTYFLLPEPQRKLVLLPTTSPYFHWNQVSEALGDSPGMVAVSGFTPDMLASAERTMLGATARMLRKRASRAAASVDVVQADRAVAAHR